MKNRQGPRSRKRDPAEAGIDDLQLDLWTFSPPPAPIEPEPVPVATAESVESAPEPTAALPPISDESSNPTQVIEEKTVHSPTRRQAGRWPARHGVSPVAAPMATIVSGGSPLTPRSEDGLALTRRQHELLDYLRRRRQQGLLPPSLTEICRDLGLASRGSLHKQVVALVKANLVEPMLGKQRGVRLVGEAANDDARVPLLGAIAAGRPIEAVLRQESVEVPPWMTRGLRCYALRVKGDSMRDAGILDGDVVLVEPRTEARNGETVVALIDNEEATLKRIEQRPGEVLLFPENSAHTVQRYTPDRVQVQGVAMGVLRRY
jgi:repressor LexA